MGYQNNNRPKTQKWLEVDILFDLSDLIDDVTYDRLSKDELIEAMRFVKKTHSLLLKSLNKTKKKPTMKREKQ
jgi:hypothetical protein